MNQLAQFIMNHWALWLILLVILLLLFTTELQAGKNRAKALAPQAATLLINQGDSTIFDIRDKDTFEKGHIVGAIQVKPDDFSTSRLNKYKDKTILLVCHRGIQSGQIAASLKSHGFKEPFILAGGIEAWQNAQLPLVKGK